MVPHSQAGEWRYCFDARTTHCRRTRVLYFSESIMTARTRRRPGSACHFGLFVPEYSKADCNECLYSGRLLDSVVQSIVFGFGFWRALVVKPRAVLFKCRPRGP